VRGRAAASAHLAALRDVLNALWTCSSDEQS
jgi:hypothetical protein